jgi:hypothetical protein
VNSQAAFRILELREGAPRAHIKQAYRDLIKVWHPDRFDGEPRLRQRATKKLQQINRAYKFLKSYRPKPPPVPPQARRQQQASPPPQPKPKARKPPPGPGFGGRSSPPPGPGFGGYSSPPPRSKPEPEPMTEAWFEEPGTNAIAVVLWILLELTMIVAMYGCTALLGG